MTQRLEVLKASLKKKEDQFDAKLAAHFASVKNANGQPLNDKRTGRATMSKWERQKDALRREQEGIEATKRAIEREESKIAMVASVTLPTPILSLIEAGVLVQWRKHSNRFFVQGVDKARIVWDEQKQVVEHQYLREVPADQYPKFRDTFNQLRKNIQPPG